MKLVLRLSAFVVDDAARARDADGLDLEEFVAAAVAVAAPVALNRDAQGLPRVQRQRHGPRGRVVRELPRGHVPPGRVVVAELVESLLRRALRAAGVAAVLALERVANLDGRARVVDDDEVRAVRAGR